MSMEKEREVIKLKVKVQTLLKFVNHMETRLEVLELRVAALEPQAEPEPQEPEPQAEPQAKPEPQEPQEPEPQAEPEQPDEPEAAPEVQAENADGKQ